MTGRRECQQQKAGKRTFAGIHNNSFIKLQLLANFYYKIDNLQFGRQNYAKPIDFIL
jgi:hypothetical protein